MTARQSVRTMIAAAAIAAVSWQAAPLAAGAQQNNGSTRPNAQKQDGKSQDKSQQERFTALAIIQGGPYATVPVDIVVNQWSSNADETRLLTALEEQTTGKKLLNLLEDMPALGSVAAPGSVGIQVRFARRTMTAGGGEHVTLLTNRPIGFAEAADQSRSTDYPFTVIDLTVNGRGEGQGTISLATKINMDRDTRTIVLENYDIQPIQLTSVKRMK